MRRRPGEEALDRDVPWMTLMPNDDDVLLSRDDIEREYVGISRRYLELAAHRGEGSPMLKLSRRMVRYRRGEFIAWLEAHRVSTSDAGQ
jgi:hypothetical protein